MSNLHIRKGHSLFATLAELLAESRRLEKAEIEAWKAYDEAAEADPEGGLDDELGAPLSPRGEAYVAACDAEEAAEQSLRLPGAFLCWHLCTDDRVVLNIFDEALWAEARAEAQDLGRRRKYEARALAEREARLAAARERHNMTLLEARAKVHSAPKRRAA